MLEKLPDDIIDTSAVALERIANAQAYMNAVLNISESQEADTESTFADIEGDALDELQWQCNDIEWTLNATIHCDSNFLYPILTKESTNLEHRVSGIYYYHPDHLGSATWITNSARVPVEFIHYMPFGELWYNQQASAYNERFKFTGKERDEETGYDYFGARYYSSALPMWLSVDPLADKYPNISPYAYCEWNPIKFVDPDGRKIVVGTWYGRAFAKLGFNNFEAKVMAQLKELKNMDPALDEMITKIEEPKTEYHITDIDGNGLGYDNSKKEIFYNPDSKETKNGRKRPAIVGLAHELGHVENDVDGSTVEFDKEKAKNGDPVEREKCNKNEQNSIGKENIVRTKLGCKNRPNDYFTNDDY